MTSLLPETLDRFLSSHAESLDADATRAAEVLPALGAADLLRRGVPVEFGGDGSTTADAVDAIAAVAERSLTAAFVFWGQRAFIEYLLQSPNDDLRARWLPELLTGRFAGATGLSNAMKFLSGIEALQVQATTLDTPGEGAGRFRLDGQVPWATNLSPQRFILAAAVARADGAGPLIAALPFDRDGLERSHDLDLIALRGSHTASVRIAGLELTKNDVIALDAKAWLPRVRPAFLAMQCGMSIGLARASLAAARVHGGAARPVLGQPIGEAQSALDGSVAAIHAGLADGRFIADPVSLFELRIQLAHTALQSVQLELQASGGRAYHRDQPLGFARRWREAAFIPIVTPSLTQLQGELLKRAGQQVAA